jgi:hypothetical protein
MAGAFEWGLFWTLYGPVSDVWLAVLCGAAVAYVLVGPETHWRRTTVLALLVVGLGASLFGAFGSGAVGFPIGRTYGPDAYYAFAYDWQTNRLHFGMTSGGGRGATAVEPYRGAVVGGVLSLALCVYGRLPPCLMHPNPDGKAQGRSTEA